MESVANMKNMVRTSDPVVWPSEFSGLEVIVNRETPNHRDPGASPSFYDLLVSLGKGHRAVLALPDLGAELAYYPGTMVYILGKVLEHGVPQWGDGERIVIAHFVKDKVHDRLGVPRPKFPNQRDFLNRVGAGKKGGLKAIRRSNKSRGRGVVSRK